MEMCLMVAAEQDLPESLNLPVPVNSERPTTTKTTMAPARRLQEEIKHGFLWLARILHSSRRSLPFENRIGVWPPRALPSVETTIDFLDSRTDILPETGALQ